jgi:FtsP/CotA-like multicopper oxidase with cupredoxin domain
MKRSKVSRSLCPALMLPLIAAAASAFQSPQVPLPGSAIPQFVDPLPDLDVLVAGDGQIELQMREFQAMVLPADTVPGYAGTWVWGYLQPGQQGRASYLGPVILATRGRPTEMKFVNQLGDASTTHVLAYRYSTDQTLHWADPLGNESNDCAHMADYPEFGDACAMNYDGPIPAAVHLHGGEVPPGLDGGPDSWFTSDGLHRGHGAYSRDGAAATNYSIYRYPNVQEGAPLWFHDHTLGATRLNVYAGLAGAWVLVDPANDPADLPPLVPLVIQDRMFDTEGQLFFPADRNGDELYSLNPEHPYWVPEFVGDVVVVNGKAWPYKAVEQRRYTFLFLNGSNARTYEMFLVDPVTGAAGPNLWVIGTDGGYLDAPVLARKLLMMPGERYQVIVDFNGRPGSWLLKNTAKTPYPAGETPAGATVGHVMQFNVAPGSVIDTSFDPSRRGATLRGGAGQGPPIVRLVDPAAGTLAHGVVVDRVRQLTLNEVEDEGKEANDPVTDEKTDYPGGPLEVLVNNTMWNGQQIIGVKDGRFVMQPIPGFTPDGLGSNYLSELPNEGETELWEIVNTTADAHPIHLHLAQFQLMNRQSFNVPEYMKDYAFAFPGGGYDAATGAAYPAGVYIPGFGPPLDYNTGNARALGGNPDIASVGRGGRPLYLQGPIQRPTPKETGWKDTVVTYPGQVTRLVVRWAPTDLPATTDPAAAWYPFDPNGGHGYVWHCHIIDHEDNEMMRPDEVIPNPNAQRSYHVGTDY